AVYRIQSPYKKANRRFHEDDSVIDIDGVKVGGSHFMVCAGSCSVENEEDTVALAKALKDAGANTLRGGAFKPRTSPYSFQGLGIEGLRILNTAKQETGLPIVSELMGTEYIDEFVDMVDVIQVDELVNVFSTHQFRYDRQTCFLFSCIKYTQTFNTQSLETVW